MPKEEGTRRRRRCPECEATVREDRLAAHLSSVHPRALVPKELSSHLKGIAKRPKTSKNGQRGGSWTRGRLLAMGIGVVVVVLVAYALLRAPSAPTPSVGKPAPDFTIALLGGSTSTLASYQGHPVVLWFVTTFCSSCSQGTSLFAQQYYGQYHADGVTLLEVESYNDLGQPGPDLSTFATQNGYSSQAGWVVGTSDAQGTHLYNPSSYLDMYYVVSSQGTLLQGPLQPLPGNFGAALQAAHGQ